jgi:hypothetical protein
MKSIIQTIIVICIAINLKSQCWTNAYSPPFDNTWSWRQMNISSYPVYYGPNMTPSSPSTYVEMPWYAQNPTEHSL